MKELIEDIIYYLENNKNVTYEKLEKYIRNVSKINREPNVIIDLLENEGILYSINGIYRLLPNNYKIGTLKSSIKGNTYVILDDNSKLDIDRDYLNGALPNDKIIYSLDGKIIKILKRKSSPVLCQVKEKNGNKILVPHNIKGVLNLRINAENLKSLSDGDYILVKPGKDKIKDKFKCEQIGEKIILTNTEIDPSLALIALEHECDLDYSKEVYEELNNIPEEVSKEDIEARKNHDLRKEQIFTLDGISTKDMDDAIGIKLLPNGNYEISVHIAEPNHYAKPGTALFEEARKRKFTMYLLNTAIHMFPPKMANGICSLNEKVDRLTKSVIMEIDKNGNIVNSKVCKSVINSKKKMTYDDVNSILENNIIPDGYEPFVEDLKNLEEITRIINHKREEEGLIRFEISETKINLDNNNNASFYEEHRGISERIVETFMILANSEIATLLYNSPFPTLYRVHGAPNIKRLHEITNSLKRIGYKVNEKELNRDPRIISDILKQTKNINENDLKIASNLILSSFQEAKYSTEQEMHWALFLKNYTHFTSPIRRYIDYQIHILLDKFFELKNTDELQIKNNYNYVTYEDTIDKTDYQLLKKELKIDAKDATRKEKLFEQAEYQANMLIILRTMKERIDTNCIGVIQKIEQDYIRVLTEDGIEGIVYYEDILGDTYSYSEFKKYAIGKKEKEKLKIGNSVNLTIKGIDENRYEVLFTINSKIIKYNNPKVYVKK